MLKRIHINQHNIRKNSKDNSNLPVITIKTYKENIKTNTMDILGPSKIVYSPDKPLACGAKLWIETESDVEVWEDEIGWRVV